MKTLIINGSPRKNGDTVALLKEFKETLEGEVIELSAYHDKISPCIDCRFCFDNGRCCIKDKMEVVYDDSFDNVVIASPLYMSGFPGPLISLASRLQVYYVNKHFLKKENKLKKKRAGLILVGGGDGTPKRAISYAEWIFNSLNATFGNNDIVTSLKTNELSASQDEDAKVKVRKLANKFNKNR